MPVAGPAAFRHMIESGKDSHGEGHGMDVTAKGVICIGGATVDRKYRTKGPVQPRTSNPVTSERTFGGVARNVAESIARLGAKASLITILGQDDNGRAVLEHLRAIGIDTRHVTLSPGHATAEYVAVLDPSGDLALGLADMGIFDSLTPARIEAAMTPSSAAWVFADCNLPAPTLHTLLDSARKSDAKIAVDAVSAPKVSRLPQDLSGVDLLFLNRDEAQALLGQTDAAPEAMAEALLRRGAGRIVLTLGADGLLAGDGAGLIRIGAVPVTVVDATGAGDALIAATLVGLLTGRVLSDAARLGTMAAALTLESPFSVRPDLSLPLLDAALSRTGEETHERTPS